MGWLDGGVEVDESRDSRRLPDPGHVFFAERVQLSLHEQRVIERLEQQTCSHDPDFAAQFTPRSEPPKARRRSWRRFWRR